MPHHDHQSWLLDERRRLGDRIRERRMQCDLTQEGLAHEAEVSRDTVHRIERGLIDPRISYLWRIARVLGVPLSDLVREDPPARASP
ncbi:helix-turn-helix transcriptional regulator [Streptomyces griseus]|uniref:helix-turn-helix transcriptional regulator n=1 Tax=Streptomyces griseus TaxID=1911 RepID=UPI0033B54A97